MKELEHQPRAPKTSDLAERMAKKIFVLDSDFRAQHHALIDLIEEDEALEREQEALDAHDDLVTDLSVRIKQIISSSSSSVTDSSRKILSRKLIHIQKCIDSIVSFIDDTSTTETDVCLLRQYEEKAADINRDLAKVRDNLHHLDIEDTDKLLEHQEQLEGQVFDCSVHIKKLLSSVPALSDTSAHPPDSKGVKLPKLDVPKFDGEILYWRSFWEQFCISVHERTNLSNSEKLVYLQQSLKGGSAKSVIEGLSRSGDNYTEAVECLQSRYDRPRLIHKTHVRMILDTPPLKEGIGKELRRLQDTVQQHLRALKAIDYEAPGPFITFVLEVKLDQNTLFEWHKHSGESTTVPHYSDVLEFINLRAQASESLAVPSKGSTPSANKKQSSNKPIASFAASASESSPNCLICKTEKHPLYACPRFKLMSHEQMMEILKSNTKIRAVFDASAKSSSSTSLNDILQVGPTIHSPLIDVLLRFRLHQIALTADVSKMYRAIKLAESDRDLHRFVWRSNPDDPLRDYRMTRIMFGVSASSFVANMSVKQNALDHALEFPKAANVVETSFYVDDCSMWMIV